MQTWEPVPSLTANPIEGLSPEPTGLGGATEFVVTSGNFQNYFDATGAPDSYYLQVYVDRAVKLANRLYERCSDCHLNTS
mgnify:CR=1 FL=1